MSGWITMPTIEDEILLWAAGGDGEGAPAWMPAALHPVQSARLAERAVAEGMAGLLFRRLKTSGRLGLLAQREGERLQAAYYRTLQANLRHLALLPELLPAFDAAGVRAAVIQGMSLLTGLYDDPGVRPVSDIDLWVLPETLESAAAVLARLDFRGSALYPCLFRRGEVLIDLHTHLLGGERVRARRLFYKIDQQSLFKECRRFVHEGCELRCLNPPDEAIYVTLHAIKHNLERLVWIADLRRLVAGWGPSEWEELGRRAADLGQPRVPALLDGLLSIVGTGLPAAESTRGGAVPEIPPAPLFQRGVKGEILFQREKKGEILFQRGGEGEVLSQRGEEAGVFSYPNFFPPLAKGARGIFSLLSSGERSRAGHELSVLERHLLRRRRQGPLPKWSSLVLLHAGSGLNQLAFALESMFPRPEVLRQVFPGREDLKNWQLYALRIRQLLGMLR